MSKIMDIILHHTKVRQRQGSFHDIILRLRGEFEYERFREIEKWLKDHTDVTHWVAVDDLNMSTEFFQLHFAPKDPNEPIVGLLNFVHTPRSSEGIKQVGVKEKIVKLLNG